MIKLIIFFLIFSLSLLAKEIHPTSSFNSVGYVNCFIVNKNQLFAGNNIGIVDVFDIKTKKITNQIILPPLTTAMNKLIAQNIISVDYLNGKILIVSIGEKTFRNVWIYENNELKKIVDESKKLTIKKAMFVNDDRILFGTFGSEVILHDTYENYNLYKSHVEQSTIGGIMLSEDKTKMITSHESGKVNLIDVSTSKLLNTYDTQNVDNIYDVAYSNGVILTAGQDRRVAIYQNGEKDYHIKSNFPVYAVGLSPNGNTGAYSSGDEQNIQIFDTKTKKLGDILVGHTSRLTQIWFANEKEIYTVGNRHKIYYWKLN
ncbi:WD40 repeat domain-containing protein [Sulfurimonas sp.]